MAFFLKILEQKKKNHFFSKIEAIPNDDIWRVLGPQGSPKVSFPSKKYPKTILSTIQKKKIFIFSTFFFGQKRPFFEQNFEKKKKNFLKSKIFWEKGIFFSKRKKRLGVLRCSSVPPLLENFLKPIFMKKIFPKNFFFFRKKALFWPFFGQKKSRYFRKNFFFEFLKGLLGTLWDLLKWGKPYFGPNLTIETIKNGHYIHISASRKFSKFGPKKIFFFFFLKKGLFWAKK